jgi:transposase
MTKYSFEERLSAVNRYLDGGESFISIGRSIGTSQSVVMNWVKQYQSQGIEALKKKGYTNYSSKFKLDVLNYMDDNGTSPNETAAIFNIPSPATIRNWRILFEKGGIDALTSKDKGRPIMKKETKRKQNNNSPDGDDIESLKAEVEQLRMENEYLKKLNALVQNKKKSPNKTKRK